MGFIYKITNTCTTMVYIGQTRRSIEERWKEHKKTANFYKKRKLAGNVYDKPTAKLYKATNKYGIENFQIILVIEVGEDQLDEFEVKYIDEYDSYKNGYNSTCGGSGNTTYLTKNHDNSYSLFRKHIELLEGMPKYCIYINTGKSMGFAVNKHPKCTRKNFTAKRHGSMEEAKNKLLEFLEELEQTQVQYIPKYSIKNESDLPAGVRKLKKGGYFVDKTHKGVTYRKAYSKKDTDAENRNDALAYLAEILMINQ